MGKKSDNFFSNSAEQSKKTKSKDEDNSKDDVIEGKIKKPFDKKSYRLKKYSKKYKLDQWEEQRKKKLLKSYYQDIQNDPTLGEYRSKTFDEDNDQTDTKSGRFVRHPDAVETLAKEDKDNTAKKDPYWRAKAQYNKIKLEKLSKRQEQENKKKEKEQKLLEYKKKKAERYKKLSRKTKKGQPVMTGRLELLLDKIQRNN